MTKKETYTEQINTLKKETASLRTVLKRTSVLKYICFFKHVILLVVSGAIFISNKESSDSGWTTDFLVLSLSSLILWVFYKIFESEENIIISRIKEKISVYDINNLVFVDIYDLNLKTKYLVGDMIAPKNLNKWDKEVYEIIDIDYETENFKIAIKNQYPHGDKVVSFKVVKDLYLPVPDPIL